MPMPITFDASLALFVFQPRSVCNLVTLITHIFHVMFERSVHLSVCRLSDGLSVILQYCDKTTENVAEILVETIAPSF